MPADIFLKNKSTGSSPNWYANANNYTIKMDLKKIKAEGKHCLVSEILINMMHSKVKKEIRGKE